MLDGFHRKWWFFMGLHASLRGVNVTKHGVLMCFISWNFMGAAHSWRRVAIKVFRREEDGSTSWDLSQGHFWGSQTTHHPPYHGQQLSRPSGYVKIAIENHHLQWEYQRTKSPFSIAMLVYQRVSPNSMWSKAIGAIELLASIGIYVALSRVSNVMDFKLDRFTTCKHHLQTYPSLSISFHFWSMKNINHIESPMFCHVLSRCSSKNVLFHH